MNHYILIFLLHFAALIVAVLAWDNDETLRINLKTGRVLGFSEHVTFKSVVHRNDLWNQTGLYPQKNEPRGCSLQTVLRLDTSGPFTGVRFQLVYNRPKLWTFHMSQNENALGFGVERIGSSVGAELQIYNRQLRVYGRQKNDEHANSDLLKIIDDAVPRKIRSSVNVEVDNNGLKWDVKEEMSKHAKSNSAKIVGGSWYVQSEMLFDFRDANVSSLYVGLNRAVGSAVKHGHGLCSVAITLQKQREKRDECRAVNHTCDKNAFCRGTKNTFRCICKSGYSGNGQVCADENECDHKNGNCVQLCANYDGGYSCSCFSGFQLASNGHDCLDVDECRAANGRCAHNCHNTIGSYRCSCRNGYLLAPDGLKCIEASLSEPCKRLNCSYGCASASFGSRCFCKSGFKLHPNGKDCVPSCSIGNGGCKHKCVETPLGSTCSCQADYFLAPDLKTCIATCAIDNGGCERLCKDTDRGAKCVCPHGYRLNSDNRTCFDIDECRYRNGRCQYKCINTLGGFECACPPGYTLGMDQRSCQDVNECNFNHTCDQKCINTAGSYKCACATGYYLHGFRYCGDIDECSDGNAGCQHRCVNTPGSYHCTCPGDATLQPNGKDCIEKVVCNELELNELSAYVKQKAATLKCNDADQQCTLDCGQSAQSFYLKPEAKYSFVCSADPSYQACSDPTLIIPVEISFLNEKCELSSNNFVSRSGGITCEDSIDVCSVEIVCDQNEIGRKYGFVHVRVKMNVLATRPFQAHASGVFAHMTHTKIRNALSKNGLKIKRSDSDYLLKMPKRIICTDSVICHCKAGTFFDFTYGVCIPCPSGFYQPLNNSFDCIPCPSETIWSITGATNLESCDGLCEPGFFSQTGVQPCDECPSGTYQPDKGRSSCIKCGHGIRTSVGVASSFESCSVHEHCRQGHFYNQNKKRCVSCPVGTYQPKSGQNFCLKCPKNTITDYVGSTFLNQCKSNICTKIANDSSGLIESPNYPYEYPSNVACTWEIKAASNRRILIFIPDLQLASDNCKDYLVLRKNASPFSTVTFESCESQLKPVAFTARSRRVWIQFKSNEKNNAKGFRMQYTTYHEQYHPLIEDIVRDSRLYTLPNHRLILQNRQFLEAFMDVVSDPNNYRKYMNVTANVFPKSFLEILWSKLHRFFDLGDL